MTWRGWRVEVREGAIIPKGYGIAYYVPDRATSVIMPLGVNVLACWARAVYWWLRFPPGRMIGAREWREAHGAGWTQGYAAGCDRGFIDGTEHGRTIEQSALRNVASMLKAGEL